MNLPKILKKGQTIGVIAPASASAKENIDKLKSLLEKYGYKVKMGKYVYDQNKYLAGTDEERAEDFNAMFRDEEVDAILCIRGGYGTPRMLDLIDYDAIIENPKILLGYSDITGIHTAINNKANLVTYHGPMGVSDMINGFDEVSKKNLENIIAKNGKNLVLENPKGIELEVINKGIAQGEIIGGNLSLLSDLIGTEYEVKTQGKILFIEEIEEIPRNIDRMLNQLRLAGKIEDAVGIILGDFNNCVTEDLSYSLDEVLDQYFKGIGKPVLKNFKAGHCEPMITIPFGAKVELDCDSKKVTVMEDTVMED